MILHFLDESIESSTEYIPKSSWRAQALSVNQKSHRAFHQAYLQEFSQKIISYNYGQHHTYLPMWDFYVDFSSTENVMDRSPNMQICKLKGHGGIHYFITFLLDIYIYIYIYIHSLHCLLIFGMFLPFSFPTDHWNVSPICIPRRLSNEFNYSSLTNSGLPL
jgi:hypothetical protein